MNRILVTSIYYTAVFVFVSLGSNFYLGFAAVVFLDAVLSTRVL